LEAEKQPDPQGSLKERLWKIVFEAETPKGRLFDIALLWLIALSVLVIMLESVPELKAKHRVLFLTLEWFFTIVFTIEYFLRIWLVRNPKRYIFSFFGIIDLISCLPTYLQLFIPGAQTLLVIRILRLLRIFRILKMIQHIRGADLIIRSLISSRAKISVFFFTMFVFSVIVGTILYLIESRHPESMFTNIPLSIYYTIITITTIGFGDITPQTPLGMIITAFTGLMGYAVIAVPTGIISADLAQTYQKKNETTEACPSCGVHGHLMDARFCRKCGDPLKQELKENPELTNE